MKVVKYFLEFDLGFESFTFSNTELNRVVKHVCERLRPRFQHKLVMEKVYGNHDNGKDMKYSRLVGKKIESKMAAAEELRSFDFVIVGGGIAGVSCTEFLSNLNESRSICLISSTQIVKSVCNIKKITQILEEYNVEERPLESVANECGNVTVVKATVVGFDPVGMRYQYYLINLGG